ncbi:MAG TPA: nucleoside 2-deoxyribosyltransferase [Stellaceae bacterium]|nr:nucleoside 2-deoxyribosyltransferase [Stellaceae bacterium]
MRRLYLAGPDVFLPDAIEMGRRKKALCTRYGVEGLYPLDNEIAAAGGASLDRLIYRANVAMIRTADAAIVNLTPFRGPSADTGTVFELGLLSGLGKPAFCYTNDAADLIERVRRHGPAVFDGTDWRDSDGMSIEDFGNVDNLMIDAAVAELGCPIIRHPAPPDRLYQDLDGFEACLRMAVATLG